MFLRVQKGLLRVFDSPERVVKGCQGFLRVEKGLLRVVEGC